ncbi:MAG: hypothetical protein CBC05_04210 [Crocinitomicaceae bacterium TMED45]|nr:MAG: hypothetical protein CBC05_04210 [Crocinitomicaceae bacterium TMED45]
MTNVEYVAVTTLIVQTAVECQMETVHLVMEHAVLADLIFLRVRATAMAMSLMNVGFAEGQASLRALVTATAMSSMNVAFVEGQASLRASVTATAMSSMNAESVGEQEFLLAFAIVPATPSTTAAYVVATTLVVPT